jgi:hypothetical protein
LILTARTSAISGWVDESSAPRLGIILTAKPCNVSLTCKFTRHLAADFVLLSWEPFGNLGMIRTIANR